MNFICATHKQLKPILNFHQKKILCPSCHPKSLQTNKYQFKQTWKKQLTQFLDYHINQILNKILATFLAEKSKIYQYIMQLFNILDHQDYDKKTRQINEYISNSHVSPEDIFTNDEKRFEQNFMNRMIQTLRGKYKQKQQNNLFTSAPLINTPLMSTPLMSTPLMSTPLMSSQSQMKNNNSRPKANINIKGKQSKNNKNNNTREQQKKLMNKYQPVILSSECKMMQQDMDPYKI